MEVLARPSFFLFFLIAVCDLLLLSALKTCAIVASSPSLLSIAIPARGPGWNVLPGQNTTTTLNTYLPLYILGWAFPLPAVSPAEPGTASVMVQAGHGSPLVRIPYKLLRDFSVDGALGVVLHACLHYKTAQGWRRMEWQNSGKQEGCVEMLRLALQELQVTCNASSPT